MAEFPVAVITDEFSQDFDRVCATAEQLGIPELEIRTAWDKNVLAMTDHEIGQLKTTADRRGLRFICVASPVYKCVLPEGGDIDARFHHDAFQAAYSFEDQPRILARALDIAARLEAPCVRVFSFWRTVDPERNLDRIVEILRRGGETARKSGILLGIENEHACHFATGAEVGRAARGLDPGAYGVVWDPANACWCHERAWPDGYGTRLRRRRASLSRRFRAHPRRAHLPRPCQGLCDGPCNQPAGVVRYRRGGNRLEGSNSQAQG